MSSNFDNSFFGFDDEIDEFNEDQANYFEVFFLQIKLKEFNMKLILISCVRVLIYFLIVLLKGWCLS